MKKYIALILLLHIILGSTFFRIPLAASGGYDHGTLTGKGQVELDFTWNPFNIFDYGQSYVVWGVGLTNSLDFHGYYSHDADGKNQIYYGFMYGLMSTERYDLSTAIGARTFLSHGNSTDLFFPQCLYTIKLDNYINVGGSIVYVIDQNSDNGITYDVAVFLPIFNSKRDSGSGVFKDIDSIYLGLGFFKPLSGHIYPTYSIDIKFKPWF